MNLAIKISTLQVYCLEILTCHKSASVIWRSSIRSKSSNHTLMLNAVIFNPSVASKFGCLDHITRNNLKKVSIKKLSTFEWLCALYFPSFFIYFFMKPRKFSILSAVTLVGLHCSLFHRFNYKKQFSPLRYWYDHVEFKFWFINYSANVVRRHLLSGDKSYQATFVIIFEKATFVIKLKNWHLLSNLKRRHLLSNWKSDICYQI